ncbi:kinase-like protein [Sporormia fimetaria CBS 119925]|uniref:Kinase-like protein n=1 Tax=Sporormia fimetaria CBS 119925 TaxID=1340428 RepID=A0A6A6VF30_9PLEO|nr:kinase-like protein [Sporormia fimetaria CBS 119925]
MAHHSNGVNSVPIPLLRVNSLSPTDDSSEHSLEQVPDPHPESKLKGVHYDSLGGLLRECSIPHANPMCEMFWPYTLLERILTRPRIVEELLTYQEPEGMAFSLSNAERYADRILSVRDSRQRHVKVFAVLLLLGKGQEIVEFMEAGVSDEELPLLKLGTNAKPKMCFKGTTTGISVFKKWSLHEISGFNTWQHIVNAVFLSLDTDQTVKHEKFDERVVMPWISYEMKQIGGYSTVYCAQVPEQSHGFTDVLKAIKFNDKFSVKELKAKDEKRMKEQEKHFWDEVKMLKKFSGAFHDHLATLLMTWEVGAHHYFLFPWAFCDLDEYWRLKGMEVPFACDTGHMDKAGMTWLSSQILGMTSALRLIHNPPWDRLKPEERRWGRHGDIKPENILFYHSEKHPMGIFVIADFGLGALNSDKSRSNIPGAEIPRTPGYRPPECDLEGGVISRSFDIWTYGCLLLELVCWALGGAALRERFDIDRTSPYITGANTDIFFGVSRLDTEDEEYVIKVKDQVRAYYVKLHAHPRCTGYFHDLLNLIEDDMLIVLTDTQPRITCRELATEIERMHGLVTDPQTSATYCQIPAPRKHELKRAVAFKGKMNALAKGHVNNNRGAGLGVHKGEVRKIMDAEKLKGMANAP